MAAAAVHAPRPVSTISTQEAPVSTGDKSMTVLRLIPPPPSRDLIDAAIATHGASRVLRAALRALLHRPARPPDASRLPAHLRRDIGLPPLPPAPSRPDLPL